MGAKLATSPDNVMAVPRAALHDRRSPFGGVAKSKKAFSRASLDHDELCKVRKKSPVNTPIRKRTLVSASKSLALRATPTSPTSPASPTMHQFSTEISSSKFCAHCNVRLSVEAVWYIARDCKYCSEVCRNYAMKIVDDKAQR